MVQTTTKFRKYNAALDHGTTICLMLNASLTAEQGKPWASPNLDHMGYLAWLLAAPHCSASLYHAEVHVAAGGIHLTPLLPPASLQFLCHRQATHKHTAPVRQRRAMAIICLLDLILIDFQHGGCRQPMCDPEGCATVLGAVGGGSAVSRQAPQGGRWVPEHAYLKMIPMTR